ncbi:MAG: MOSC domain-containing protein [Granulosicoccus sp.]
MATTVSALTRYPVKGLSGQQLESVTLNAGQGFPADRQFGFARPNSGFDPANPKPLPKSRFYMLARDASLALTQSEYNDETGVLLIANAQQSAQFDIRSAEGKDKASLFIKQVLSLPDDETPQLYEASPHRFTDASVDSVEMMNAVSIINTDSVHEFSKTIGQEVDPRRFRGNIHVSGLAPFSELDMVGHNITIGDAQFKIVQRTRRCPATEVDLNTGERNMKTPKLLREYYGHMDMGVYAEVVQGGVISPGDIVELL